MQPQLGVPVVSQFAMAEMVWVGTQGEQGKGYNVDRVARGHVYSGCRGALRCAMIFWGNNVDCTTHVCGLAIVLYQMDMTTLTVYTTRGQVYLL